jgi:hypothetical protein
VSAPVRTRERSDRDLLDLVNEAGLGRMLREPLAKDIVLAALEARAELVDRLLRWRWLAIEQARAAGASWAEVDDAAGLPAGGARAEYHAVLDRQRRFGLVDARRADPGPAEGPGELGELSGRPGPGDGRGCGGGCGGEAPGSLPPVGRGRLSPATDSADGRRGS